MKFAVLICSVLLIAGAQANPDEHHEHHHHGHHHERNSWTERIERIQLKIQNAIQEGLGEIIEVTEAGKLKSEQMEKTLQNQIKHYEAGITEQTNSILQEVKAKIRRLAEHAGKIDVEECVELSNGLDALAQEAIANMTVCANKRLEKGEGYIKILLDVSDKIIANLTSLRQGVKHCAEEVDDITSATQAIVCIDLVAAQSLWATSQGIPIITSNMGKLIYLLNTLHVSLSHCTNDHGLNQFIQESSVILRKVQKCVHKTIEMSEHELLHEYIHHGDGHLKKPRSGRAKIEVKAD